MKPTGAKSWLLVLAMAGVVASTAWLARGWMLAATHQRLEQQYQQRIATLPEGQAARLVRELARRDRAWIGVILAASADDRDAVAAAAESELRDLVERWSALPAAESSSHVAELASLLAGHAPRLPAERRHLAQALAERLIVWPIDGRQVDVARLIAECQAVLLLPRTEPADIRVATTAVSPPIDAASPVAQPLSLPTSRAAASPDEVIAPVVAPTMIYSPDSEPRRLIAPQGIRISDD
jgi:hypothetical protein